MGDPPALGASSCRDPEPTLTARCARFARPGRQHDAMRYAIQAEGLVKRFGETTALDGVDLAAVPGSVLAVLGPNGCPH